MVAEPELIAKHFGRELRKRIALSLAAQGLDPRPGLQVAEARLKLLTESKTPFDDLRHIRQSELIDNA